LYTLRWAEFVELFKLLFTSVPYAALTLANGYS